MYSFSGELEHSQLEENALRGEEPLQLYSCSNTQIITSCLGRALKSETIGVRGSSILSCWAKLAVWKLAAQFNMFPLICFHQYQYLSGVDFNFHAPYPLTPIDIKNQISVNKIRPQ